MVIEFWEKKLLYRNWLGFNWKCWITLQPLVPSFFVSSPLSLRNHYFFKLWVSHITKLSIQVWNKIIALIIIEVHQFFIYCLFNWNKKKYFQIFQFTIFISNLYRWFQFKISFNRSPKHSHISIPITVHKNTYIINFFSPFSTFLYFKAKKKKGIRKRSDKHRISAYFHQSKSLEDRALRNDRSSFQGHCRGKCVWFMEIVPFNRIA